MLASQSDKLKGWPTDKANSMINDFYLRDVIEDDLPVFFDYQLDPDANYMAAFTAKDPFNRDLFNIFWHRILADETVIIKTIVFEEQVIGSVLSYEEDGKPEVSYWLGRKYWGKGLATWALQVFLEQANTKRPIFARAAKDNVASLRVLQKCGFAVTGEARGFANARGEEIAELLLELVD